MIREVRFDVEDEPARLWFIFKKKLGVESKWQVQIELTSTGLLVKGRSEEVCILHMQDIGRVVAYFRQQLVKYCYRVLKSDDDFQKLSESGLDFDSCDIQTLKKAAEQRSRQPLRLTIEGLKVAVFGRRYQNDVDSVIRSFYSEAEPLTDRQLITVLGAKAIEVSKNRFFCQLKLVNNGTAIVKGPKENVSQCLKFLRHAKKDLTYKILMSRNDDSFSEDSLKKIVDELQYCKNVFWLTEEKFRRRLIGLSCSRAEKILEQLVKTNGSFLLVVYRHQEEQYIEKLVKQFLPRSHHSLFSQSDGRNNRSSKSGGDADYSTQGKNEIVRLAYEEDYPKIKPASRNDANNQQRYAREEEHPRFDQPVTKYQQSTKNYRLPMHSLALQGIKKFDNFKKKFAELEKAYGIRFRTSAIDRQSYLEFTSNVNLNKVLEDLEYFFRDLPIVTYRIDCKDDFINTEKLNGPLQYELKNNPQYSDIVAGNAHLDRGKTVFQVFYSRRSNYDRSKQDLQKLIKGKVFEMDVRLVKVKQEDIMPANILERGCE